MDSRDLSSTQAGVLYEHIRPMMSYLHTLKERMEKRGFHPSDKLYLEVSSAYYSMHVLAQDLHKMSCVGFFPGKQGR
jgi:hypothetical protein